MKFPMLWSVLCNRTHIDTSCINEMVTLHKYILRSFIQSDDSAASIFDGLNKYTGHTLQDSAVCFFVFAFHFNCFGNTSAEHILLVTHSSVTMTILQLLWCFKSPRTWVRMDGESMMTRKRCVDVILAGPAQSDNKVLCLAAFPLILVI